MIEVLDMLNSESLGSVLILGFNLSLIAFLIVGLSVWSISNVVQLFKNLIK